MDTSKWIDGPYESHKPLGIFVLKVWTGLKANDGKQKFKSWVSIPEVKLPSKSDFDSSEEAKKWIENATRDLFLKALKWLK